MRPINCQEKRIIQNTASQYGIDIGFIESRDGSVEIVREVD